jgi:hypothetical protein
MESGTRTRCRRETSPGGVRDNRPTIPTLAQLVHDGQADAEKHRQRTREALLYWFRQSQRLNIAHTHYRLRGTRFEDFARRIGVDRSSAFALFKLWPRRDAILKRCQREAKEAAKQGETYHYPGWETALAWFAPKGSRIDLPPSGTHPTGEYWLTPPALYRALDAEFQFDFDPCPHPLPDGWDALKIEWGRCNYVNAPFSQLNGPGLTAFVRKAIAEQQEGKSSVLILPVPEMVNLLIAAGAEMRPAGRVPFLDATTGAACPHPSNCALFILRGKGAGG